MDRVRKIIAEHMVLSKRTSPHVTSFIDADVTRLVNWRNANKEKFLASEGQKLTLTPIFIDAVARALYEFPMVNISVDGNNIIKKKEYQHRDGNSTSRWKSYSSCNKKCK